MRDDPEYNIILVQEIERFPCLYDHTRDDYARRHVQEKAWKEIAAKIGETSADCKTRWKNLRGRHIKIKNQYRPSGSGAVKRKSYYLSEYLHFLDNLSPSRPSKGNVKQNSSMDASLTENDEDMDLLQGLEEEENEYDHDDPSVPESTEIVQPDSETISSFNEETNMRQQKPQPTVVWERRRKSRTEEKKSYRKRDHHQSPQTSIEEVRRSALEYFNMKKQALGSSSVKMFLEDPDAAFVFSIIPDMKKMTDNVKRRFKIRLLQLVEEALDTVN